MSELPTKIPPPMDKAPRLKLVILNQIDCFRASIPCNNLPKPLNITLIVTDNKTNGIADTVFGKINDIIAKASAKTPKPILVNRVLFLCAEAYVGVDDSKTNDILSTPIINKVIDKMVIIVCKVKKGNPNMITMEDKMSKTMPLTTCSERNHLGGTDSTIKD